MRNWLAVGVVGVVSAMVGVLGAGCSSNSPPATVNSFCQELATAECPSVEGVCATLSDTTCVDTVAAQCEANATGPAYADRAINSAAISACLSAVTGAFSSLNANNGVLGLAWTKLNGTSGTTSPAPGSPNDYCERVFQGTVALNGNCTTSYDCADGNICGSFGTCGPEHDVPLGNTCSDSGDLCENGSVCTQQGRDYICTTGASVGQSCNALTTPCSSNAQCKNGKCEALSESGGHCSSNADCDPTQQANGNYYGFCDVPNGSICTFGYTFGTNAVDCKDFSEVTPTSSTH